MTEREITENAAEAALWPSLPLAAWEDTYATLHLWTQIVGKIRLARTPWVNHSWHVPLYVTARGLTTSLIPNGGAGFQIDFDFISGALRIQAISGEIAEVGLHPRSVADFYHEVFGRLAAMGLEIAINTMPCEIAEGIPFEHDHVHQAYDDKAARRFWEILAQAHRVMGQFRARFIGKCSPVHFFWGSFDLAVTRFSGRPAPEHPGGVPHLADWVTREAYSHEVSSLGFWPGGGPAPYPLFYSYAYPEPPGYADFALPPGRGAYDGGLREFVLPYDAMRAAPSPDAALVEFAQATYDAAADLGAWDRASLEREHLPIPPRLQ